MLAMKEIDPIQFEDWESKYLKILLSQEKNK